MKQKHKRVLGRIAIIYPIFALVLLPWTLYLAESLPRHHVTLHWDISWVGLNVVLILALAMTGYLSYIQSRWVAISSTVLGSVLLLDAWFDILGQHSPQELRQALLLAIFIEIPLAITSFVIAGRALNYDKGQAKPINPYIRSKRQRSKK